jgi:hypothetical protein
MPGPFSELNQHWLQDLLSSAIESYSAYSESKDHLQLTHNL